MRTSILLVGALVLGLISCNRQGENKEQNLTRYKNANLEQDENITKMYYRFPAPKDAIDYIKTEKLIYLKEYLNPVSNADKYFDSRVQNFNLGIYTADFAYITVFKTLSEASEYFGTIEKLAYQTGLSSIFDEKLRNRVEANEANIDSLNSIARSSYSDMVNFLTLNGNEKQLAIISAGGYIEIFYLALNQTHDIDKDKELLNRIYDQRMGLENLIQFIEPFTSDHWVKTLSNNLKAINSTLQLVEIKPASKTSTSRNSKGQLTFSGGKAEISITKENYQQLKQTVISIREKYTNPITSNQIQEIAETQQ